VNVQLLYQKDKSGSLIEFYPWQGTLLPAPYGPIPTNRFISEPGWDRYDTEQAALSWQLSHRFNETWTARQNFRYSDASSDYFTMYTSFTADPTETPPRPGRPVFNADGRTVQRDIVAQVHGSKIQAIDNQAQADFATGPVRHKVLVGLDFQHIVRTQSSFRGVAPDIDVYAPVYGNFTAPTTLTPQPTVVQRQLGVYLQDQLKWNGWVASVGVRHDQARSKTESPNPAVARAASVDDNATTASAGLVYLAPWGLAPYVSYNESFLPLGGANVRGELYKPQRGKQWEAGIKWEPVDSRTTAMATVYDLRDTNRRTPDPADPQNSLQAGEVRTQGYELELRTQLGGGWSGSVANSYTNARVTKSNAADLGKRLASVPEHVSSLWVMKQTHVLAGYLTVGAGARHTGESWDGTDSLATPSYTLYDAMAAWEQGNWRVALNINNLTDKVHVTTCLARGDCFFGTRRTGVLTARYLF
jgi:iron complex outermembrane receptor protein